jgi:E3 ubiquitin-protein ligase BAH
VCDGTFFPSLLKEMSAVVGFFNERAQKLLELHLASGFRKYFIWIKGKLQKNHVTLIQEGKDLVTYALINAVAVRKILKKYDKVYLSHSVIMRNAIGMT